MKNKNKPSKTTNPNGLEGSLTLAPTFKLLFCLKKFKKRKTKSILITLNLRFHARQLFSQSLSQQNTFIWRRFYIQFNQLKIEKN